MFDKMGIRNTPQSVYVCVCINATWYLINMYSFFNVSVKKHIELADLMTQPEIPDKGWKIKFKTYFQYSMNSWPA